MLSKTVEPWEMHIAQQVGSARSGTLHLPPNVRKPLRPERGNA